MFLLDKMLRRKIYSVFVLTLMLSGCITTDEAERPQINYADSYQASPVQTNAVQTSAVQDANNLSSDIDANWWHAFNAPVLDELMLAAEQQSPDLLISAERVRQAELQMRIANASLFPSLNASASSGERRTTNENNVTNTNGSTSATLNINYEVDLWGGIAAGRKSAAAGFDATRFDQDAAQLSIKAAIASAWFQWLSLQERVASAQKNIEIAERVQKVVDARYRNGAATAAEVAQQKTNLLTQKATLLPLELQARQTRNALAILVGKTPQEFVLAEARLLDVAVPEIAPGTPADLVTRRPDLAASEANLVAANADIVAARAALLPGISLGANIGKSASELFSLNPATQASGWTVSLAQTIFNDGRIVNQKRLSEARRAEMLLQYHKAILVALQEVDTALASRDISRRQENSLQEILVQAELSVRLTEARYRAGSDDLLSLLVAQRNLFQAQDSLVQQRLARLNAAVDMYKALGGGWVLAAN